jgi:hypothetical protein
LAGHVMLSKMAAPFRALGLGPVPCSRIVAEEELPQR